MITVSRIQYPSDADWSLVKQKFNYNGPDSEFFVWLNDHLECDPGFITSQPDTLIEGIYIVANENCAKIIFDGTVWLQDAKISTTVMAAILLFVIFNIKWPSTICNTAIFLMDYFGFDRTKLSLFASQLPKRVALKIPSL